MFPISDMGCLWLLRPMGRGDLNAQGQTDTPSEIGEMVLACIIGIGLSQHTWVTICSASHDQGTVCASGRIRGERERVLKAA
jgi:hypothetical protein